MQEHVTRRKTSNPGRELGAAQMLSLRRYYLSMLRGIARHLEAGEDERLSSVAEGNDIFSFRCVGGTRFHIPRSEMHCCILHTSVASSASDVVYCSPQRSDLQSLHLS